MQWFRFYSEALDDPKVQRLPGDLFKAWVNLLCLANEQSERGTLPGLDDIAFRLRLDQDSAEDTVRELVRRGLLAHHPGDDRYAIHAWDKRQKKSDNVGERVAGWRQRTKQRSPGEDETIPQEPVTLHVTTPQQDSNALDKNREEKSREEETFGADAPLPPLKFAKPKDQAQPANPLWDALVEGVGVVPTTSAERSKYGKVVKELRDLGATPGEVRRRCANYREHWPTVDLTATALLEHWSRMDNPPSLQRARAPTQADHNSAKHGRPVI